MIIVTIGETSRRLSSPEGIDESWVTLRMRAGTSDGRPPGVHVRVDAPGIQLNLIAGDDSGAGASGHPLRLQEARVVELWRQRGVATADFSSGQLTAFLHQLYDIVEQADAQSGAGVKMVTGMSRLSETRP